MGLELDCYLMSAREQLGEISFRPKDIAKAKAGFQRFEDRIFGFMKNNPSRVIKGLQDTWQNFPVKDAGEYSRALLCFEDERFRLGNLIKREFAVLPDNHLKSSASWLDYYWGFNVVATLGYSAYFALKSSDEEISRMLEYCMEVRRENLTLDFRLADQVQNIAFRRVDYRLYGELLRQDPSGKKLIDTYVKAMSLPLEQSSLHLSYYPFQVVDLLCSGANFARRGYDLLYQTASNIPLPL